MNKNNYEQALKTLSAMAESYEEQEKIIENLAMKIRILSLACIKAGVNVNDYVTADEIKQIERK